MKNLFDWRRVWPHLAVFAGSMVLALIYMSPVLKGQHFGMHDVDRFVTLQSEIRKYAGEYIGWTNSLFGGMPTFLIGGNYSNSVFIKIHTLIYNVFNLQNSLYIAFYLFAAYLLLRAFRCNLWISVLGAIGYAFFTYNLQIIEAGHLAKVYALGYLPLMMAGLIYGFDQKPWSGAALFSLGLGLQIYSNHPQITYYSAILVGIVGISEAIYSVRNNQLKNLVTFVIAVLLLSTAAVLTNTSRLWTLLDHTKETIRGGSELTNETAGSNNKNTPKNEGLDKEYAFSWSYGKLESLTLLIPDFAGGASGGELDNKSETFKTLTRYGVDEQNSAQAVQSFPTYWGDQTFVGGGVYSGAVVCFLFVLGLFYANRRYKTSFLIAGVLCLMIGWGGNFQILNYFLFDYIPGFNKLRSVSMILSLTQFCMIVIAALGLKEIMQNRPDWTSFKRPFAISLGATAGVALVLGLVPSLVGLESTKDPAFVQQITQSMNNNAAAANDIYRALIDDRASMLRSDAFRTVFFILLAAAVLWAFVNTKLKNATAVVVVLAVLTLIDLWMVNKRYFNSNDFQPKYAQEEAAQATALDTQILQDPDLHYRVYDVTGPEGPFTDPRPSGFHKSIGGYSASKLRRYQDLIERQLSKNNMAVLNMLNAKYFIVPGQNNQPTIQRNPDALGNAWFVRKLKMVTTANEEMKALDSLTPRTTAVVDVKFADILKNAQPSADTTGNIRLTNYHPDKMTYESNTNSPQIAVFSEVFYKGNEDWKSYIDGREAPHFRADYLLRAMSIPTGKHTIEFKFEPQTVYKGQKIDLWASIVWILLVGVALVIDFKSKKENQ